MNKKSQVILSIVILLLVLIFSVVSRVSIFDNVAGGMDGLNHFYMMKSYYDAKTFPTEGAYLIAVDVDDDNSDVPRVPGGYFFGEYLLHFIIGGGDLYNARISYSVVMMLFALFFLFWLYKRFGFITTSIIASLILTNLNFLNVSHNFYNPYPALMFSFVLLPLLAQYMQSDNKSFVPSVLIFPILALMWQSHFAVFFSMIITLLVYLIIRWNKKTKYNIKGFLLGIFISFLTYVPYLISEIKTGFFNTMLILGRKENLSGSAKFIIEPPQLHTILFYPTHETGIEYRSINGFLNYWLFNDNVAQKVIFVFYVLSILFVLVALFVSFRDYFRKTGNIVQISNNQDNAIMLKEMLFFFMLYFITTFISYNVFGIGSGRAHYFYNAYTLSFIPIIYFLEYLKLHQSKFLKYILILIFINTFVFFAKANIQSSSFNNRENLYLIGEALRTIVEDSNGQRFHLEASQGVNTIGKVYFGKDKWNSTESDDANIKYIFINSNDTYNILENEILILDNKYFKIYKNDISTDNSGNI